MKLKGHELMKCQNESFYSNDPNPREWSLVDDFYDICDYDLVFCDEF